MSFAFQSEAPPLREDSGGALRIGESRVLLELVIRAFEDGATPEGIVKRYSSLVLSDVYAVIAYYLRHRDEIDAYLLQRQEAAHAIKGKLEKQRGDLSGIRAELQSRRMSQG